MSAAVAALEACDSLELHALPWGWVWSVNYGELSGEAGTLADALDAAADAVQAMAELVVDDVRELDVLATPGGHYWEPDAAERWSR